MSAETIQVDPAGLVAIVHNGRVYVIDGKGAWVSDPGTLTFRPWQATESVEDRTEIVPALWKAVPKPGAGG